jgi:hypothetical protein
MKTPRRSKTPITLFSQHNKQGTEKDTQQRWQSALSTLEKGGGARN